ncbi:carbonyl reductase [NADPH] 1-like [Notamacropus eugenii]|uniref:carbonyl reductase [NADPH] 1-like n=1 Tax=Notamacropus eugenii TaxID=9315 RepID=UPI003B677162
MEPCLLQKTLQRERKYSGQANWCSGASAQTCSCSISARCPAPQPPSLACIPTPARAQDLELVALSQSRVISSRSRVAVVTGSNKGIGFAIVRDLCKKFPGDVILTARNPTLGQEAVNKLKQEGLNPLFHQLDITDLQSIRTLREFLKERYGGVDVLVNNAGIAFKVDTMTFPIQAEVTLQINFFWHQSCICKIIACD